MTFEDLQKINAALGSMDIKGKSYIPVNERVKAFRQIFPEGTIQTELVFFEDGVCVIKATVSYGDLILATGYALEKESSSFLNKTSFLENCETSAVGRALGFLGIGIDTSIASAEEVETAVNNQERIKTEPLTIGKTKAIALSKLLLEKGVRVESVCDLYKVEKLMDLNEKQHRNIVENIDKIKELQQ